ncbi:equilibrative nucleobase transporter 1-like [Clavelina lepadiformis]|uniref:equilibrative nucleobase transporter 1-like n=1 Tax=Clavelina lepadiformis TaxID=159417 RepID=UPI00404105D0
MKVQVTASVATSLLEILFSGVIFGWPSLQFALEQEGYFSNLCANKSVSNSSGHDVPVTCDQSDAHFNLIFTLTTSTQLILSFPNGFILDRLGTWVFRGIANTLYSSGMIMMATSSPETSYILYPAVIFMGVSGLALLTSNFQLANFSQSFKGLIITFMNGMFDSSAVVFLIIKILYESGFSIQSSFLVLTGISVLLGLRTFLLMPRKLIPFMPPANLKFGWEELFYLLRKRRSQRMVGRSQSSSREEVLSEENEDEREEEQINRETLTFRDCLKTGIFWTNLFHYVIGQFRIVFFIGTFLQWIKAFDEANNISRLTNIFGALLLCGFAFAPLNGILIDSVTKYFRKNVADHKNVCLRATFASMTVTSFLLIVLSITATLQSALPSFVLLVLARAFVYSGNSAFVSLNFPVQHLGKLYGLTNAIAGLFGLIQFALFRVAQTVDPEFHYINVSFLIASCLTLVHPIFLLRAVFVRS